MLEDYLLLLISKSASRVELILDRKDGAYQIKLA
jgi:hypothetical protein